MHLPCSFHTCCILARVCMFTMLLPQGLLVYKLVECGRISLVCALLRIHEYYLVSI